MAEGKFTFRQIYDYLNDGIYPDQFEKAEKRALRKRSSFFLVEDNKLFYISGKVSASLIAMHTSYIATK